MKRYLLKNLLMSKGMSQKVLANKTGINAAFISLGIHGKYNFSAEEMKKIAEVLSMPIHVIFNNEGEGERMKINPKTGEVTEYDYRAVKKEYYNSDELQNRFSTFGEYELYLRDRAILKNVFNSKSSLQEEFLGDFELFFAYQYGKNNGRVKTTFDKINSRVSDTAHTDK